MIWLPDMDLNHDKQIQSLLCYRYTIGQTSALKVEFSGPESSSRVKRLKRETVKTGAFQRASPPSGVLINTPLQRGGHTNSLAVNRFSGFEWNLKTAKAVHLAPEPQPTPLKRCVNETPVAAQGGPTVGTTARFNLFTF